MLIKTKFEILCFILTSCASWVSSSISGISYMDPLVQKPLKPLPGENPCNPLYWYPRQIPDYCYNKVEKPAIPKPKPLIPQTLTPVAPMSPIAVPMPIPFPMYPMPVFPSAVPQFFPPPVAQMPLPQMPIPQMPMPQMPMPQMPMSQMPMPQMPQIFMPQMPMPQMPMPQMPMPIPVPYPYPPIPTQQSGLVPGLPGLVSSDGGINILPFSDAYSDILEKHKQKMIRKRLQKVLDDYDDFPRRRKHRNYIGGR